VPGLRGIGAIPNHPIQASYRAISSAIEPVYLLNTPKMKLITYIVYQKISENPRIRIG
jgi:hypothetical protein